MADLVSTVWVVGEDGLPTSFGPGDDVPAWAKKQMGDHCFAQEEPKKAPAGKSQKS